MVDEQAVAVFQHDPVKLFSLLFIHAARLQRFQVKPDGSDRRLQLMRDSVDEGIVLFITPDFAHQENRIQTQRR